MATFTVIGLRDENGTLSIAGVAEGDVQLVDTSWGSDGAQRWAEVFEADDVDHAEQQAYAVCEADPDGLEDDEDCRLSPEDIPADFPVRPISQTDPTAAQPVTDAACGLTWDDAVATAYTPAPAARCPFEQFHRSGDEAPLGPLDSVMDSLR